jgi:hypothetical protein
MFGEQRPAEFVEILLAFGPEDGKLPDKAKAEIVPAGSRLSCFATRTGAVLRVFAVCVDLCCSCHERKTSRKTKTPERHDGASGVFKIWFALAREFRLADTSNSVL